MLELHDASIPVLKDRIILHRPAMPAVSSLIGPPSGIVETFSAEMTAKEIPDWLLFSINYPSLSLRWPLHHH